MINDNLLKRLVTLTHERVEAWNGQAIEINGEPDHLHILFELPPNHAISGFINALKTGTFQRIKKKFGPHVRQYFSIFCSSFSGFITRDQDTPPLNDCCRSSGGSL